MQNSDYAIIEERETSFDGMCHGHAVALGGKQVGAQERGDFEILGTLEQTPSAEAL